MYYHTSGGGTYSIETKKEYTIGQAVSNAGGC